MISIVWHGDYAVTQPWGATTLIVEPYWQAAQEHWHCGIDVGMNVGTPLYAARDGRVRYIDYGLLAIVAGAQVDWYVHIDRALVAPGTAVKAGQQVALSGAKVPAGGSLTGPHLHFEVQESTAPLLGASAPGYLNFPASSVDPVPILEARYSDAQTALEAIDMSFTDTDRAVLNIVHLALTGSDPAVLSPSLQSRLAAVQSSLVNGSAKVTAVNAAGGGSVDLSGVLAAIADLKAHQDATTAAAVAKLEAELVAALPGFKAS